MTTYVLVHGAWGGAHGFHLVRPLLTAAGHEVFTPSLTGVGERAHLASPQIGLSTHIADVANCILYEDLRDIVLLGFSYGGMVVTGALGDVADRVRHVVYLDAFVPADGDSVTTMNGGPAGGWPLSGTELTWLVPPSAREFDDPAEAERYEPAPGADAGRLLRRAGAPALRPRRAPARAHVRPRQRRGPRGARQRRVRPVRGARRGVAGMGAARDRTRPSRATRWSSRATARSCWT